MDKIPLIEINTDRTLRLIANDIKNKVGSKYGFMVLVFPFGHSGTAHYISNADRENMILVLREQADIMELKQDMTNEGEPQ